MDDSKDRSERPQDSAPAWRRGLLRACGARNLALLTMLLAVIGGGAIWVTTPDVSWLRATNPRSTAMMRYAEADHRSPGSHGPQHWQWIQLSEISPYLIESMIVSEDAGFFAHRGFDWEELWQSALLIVQEWKIVKGGSTITQQLAKNLFLGPSRNPIRKIREAAITYALERELTKLRVLELYLNVVEWGPGVYGAEAASRHYFKKSASQLRLSEAVRLTAMLPNPSQLSPLDTTSPYVKQRYALIVEALLQRGWISRAKYDQASNEMQEIDAFEAPSAVIPYTDQLPGKLRSAGHWIAKLRDPDTVIMTDDQIRHFNDRALIVSAGISLFDLPRVIPGQEVRDKILEVAGLPSIPTGANGRSDELLLEPITITPPVVQRRYDRNNSPLGGRFYSSLIDDLNLGSVPKDVEPRYVVLTRRADVRAWPVNELFMSKPRDYAFNAILESTIYSGTPAAVVHTSKNGRWAFIRTPYFDGWVEEDALAWTTRKDAAAHPGSRFLVVTASSVRSASGVEFIMGQQLEFERRSPEGYEVKIPARGRGGRLVLMDDFVSSDGVVEGLLPYTARNVLTQAFKGLGAPYSWGGSQSGWDCSSFAQDVFAVFGIKLPRNSSWQAEVGKAVAQFDGRERVADKLKTVRLWEPGVTLLRLPGHLMIYLGEDSGRPYAIHAVWGVRDKDRNLVKINRVAVTDLELGGRTSGDGSLVDRLTDARAVFLDSPGLHGFVLSFAGWLSSHPWRFGVGLAAILLVGAFVRVIAAFTTRLLRERRC